MTISMISRSAWGARDPRSIQNVGLSQRIGFMVHHSGANPNQSVRAIQDFHMDTRGWSDIGYNFLVRNTGAVYEGRGIHRVGAHCTGWNVKTIGVCLIGDYQTVAPPDIALQAIGELYDWCVSTVGARRCERSATATPRQPTAPATCCTSGYGQECPIPAL